MWVASWNEAYPNDNVTLTSQANGYKFSRSVNSTEGVNDKLYFPHSEKVGNCQGYMLASPHSYHQNFWAFVNYTGILGDCAYISEQTGVRPVVCLPQGTVLTYNKTNGMYDINQ